MNLASYLKVIESNRERIGAQVNRFTDNESARTASGSGAAPMGATLLQAALAGHYRQICEDLDALDRIGSESMDKRGNAPGAPAEPDEGEEQ